MPRLTHVMLGGLAALTLLLRTHAAAQPAATDPHQAEISAAITDAVAHATRGPATISLLDQGKLALPQHTLWLPATYARRLLRAWGNSPSGSTLGMVAGGGGGHNWTAVVTFVHDGYVRDTDAHDLNPDTVLQKLRDSTAEENKDREARGYPALEISGWLQPPAYDSITHRLVWALSLYDIGKSDPDPTVNYNTRSLGRDGYISINELTSVSAFATDKVAADRLLTGLSYNNGKRYADFDASTDHVAEYGLAALIGVVALKKLGLIAIAVAFVAKFAKLGILAVVGAGAALRRFFNRKPKRPPAAPGAAP